MLGKFQKSFFIIIFLGIIVDQITKHFALSSLKDKPKFFLDTRLGFELRFNSGSAFSLFENSTIFITILSIVVIVFIIRYYTQCGNRLMRIALTLIIAGAFGNLIDRFFRVPYYGKGRVVDFLVLWEWPTFNVADSLVSLGVVLAILSTFLKANSEKDSLAQN